jgi:hypothetical protein
MSKELELRFRVWQLRRQGFSQSAIAEQLGLSQSSISHVCGVLEDFDALQRMIAAEEPSAPKTGHHELDQMVEEAARLKRELARMSPSTQAYHKRSVQRDWLLLKVGMMRAALPNTAAKCKYAYRARSGVMDTPIIRQMDSNIAAASLADYKAANRVVVLDCVCGKQVFGSISWQPSEVAVDYEKPEDVDEDGDGSDESQNSVSN